MRAKFKSIVSIVMIALFLIPLIPPKIAKAANIYKYYKTEAEAPNTLTENGITYTLSRKPEKKEITPTAWQTVHAQDRWKYTGETVTYEGGQYLYYPAGGGPPVIVTTKDVETKCDFLGNMDKAQRDKYGFSVSDYRDAWIPNPFGVYVDTGKGSPDTVIDVNWGAPNGQEILRQIGYNLVNFEIPNGPAGIYGSIEPYVLPKPLTAGTYFGGQGYKIKAPYSAQTITYYEAEYTGDGTTPPGGGGTTIPPSGGGTITFIPPSTAWTNIGKASGFPVQVSVSGQVITHTWIQHYTQTTKTTPWIPEKGHTDSKTGKYVVDAPAHWGTTTSVDSDISVPFQVTYTMSNISISGGATPTTLPNTGGTILVPEGGYRNLSASATYTQQKGTPTAPTGSMGPGPNGTSISIGALDQVPPPTNPTGSAGTYNIDYTDPILTLGAATNQWSRNILNVPINSYDPPGQYVPSGQSGIQSSNYSVSDSSHYGRSSSSGFYGSSSITLNDGIYSIALNNRDVAGNTNAMSDRTYYVDTTLPDCDFSVKVNQGINNGTQRVFWGNGVTRTGDKLYGTLTTHDNLSGLIYVGYVWTFGPSDSGTTYVPIYTNSVTYYDRDSERPTFNIEKPVGDNMFLHVRMTDSAGNSSYYRFGGYEDPIKLRDFRVTDVRDPLWDKVFWSDAKLTQHTGVTYNASKLPIDDKNNTVYRNAYAKKGYAFYFDLTSEYLYRAADAIEIYPTFYYWDGKTRVPVDLYYNIDNNPFIKVGSAKDTHTFNLKVKGEGIPIGGLRKLTLHDRVRLHKGQAFNSWKGTIQYTNGKEQWWYGKYYIPATSIFTRQGVSPRPENLLKKNYIIVNFNIVAYKNGAETNSFVLDNQKFFYNVSNPVFPGITSQWAFEDGSKSPYLVGDTMIYDNSRSVLDDFDTIITQ